MAQRRALPSQWTGDQTTEAEEQQWYAHLPADTLVVDAEQPHPQTAATILMFLRSSC